MDLATPSKVHQDHGEKTPLYNSSVGNPTLTNLTKGGVGDLDQVFRVQMPTKVTPGSIAGSGKKNYRLT